MEEEVLVYRGLSRFFRVRESEVYQSFINELSGLMSSGCDPIKAL
jgi:hypothetical protein